MYNSWDTSYPHLYNASISTALITPWISKIFHIDLVAIFKIIYPAIFALVPVILYFTYRKMIGNWKAIYAVLFFIAMPVFFFELPQLPRQEIAEVFFCLAILITISKIDYKVVLLSLCTLLTVMLHYTIGLITIAFLIAMLAVKLVSLKLKWGLIQNSRLSFYTLIAVLTLTAGLTAIWGLNIADNMPIRALNNVFSVGPSETTTIVTNEQTIINLSPTVIDQVSVASKSDSTIAAATGLDITNGISIWGIVFRIVQWTTQLLIILGCIRVLTHYKEYKFTTEFVACIGASAVLLILCLTVFGFSGLLGMTRFYHLALIFLAPMFVIGLDYIKKNIKEYKTNDNGNKISPIS